MSSRLPAAIQDLLRRVDSSPLARRLTRGTFWSILGGVLGRGAVLLSGIVIARILGKEAYGALGMIQNTILMLAVFAGLGMGLTATKYVAEFRLKDPRFAGRLLSLTGVVALTTGLLSTATLFALSPWLAAKILAAPYLAHPLRVSSLVFLFTSLTGALMGALAGFESFRTAAWVNLWTGLLSLVINSAFVWAAGFAGAVWGMVVSSFLTCVVTYIGIRKEANRAGVPLSFDLRVVPWWVLIRFSFPAVLSQMVVGPVRWLCSVLLVNTPNGYAEMGTFNAASQWSQVIVFLAGTLTNVSIPILSERLGRGDHHASAKVLKGSVIATAVMALPIVAVGSFLSPLIMSAYGPGFREGWPTMVVTLVTAGALALAAPVGSVIAASGRMWVGVAMNLGWGVILVVFTWLGLPLGALGLALAGLGAYLLHNIWVFAYARRVLREYSWVARETRDEAPAGTEKPCVP